MQHVAHREDLYALLYLMMGELNASHLGVSGFAVGPEEDTAELGLLFDESYKGKGLKIYEPDVAAFRKHVQEQYLASDLAKDWPAGMVEKINAL